MRTSAIFLLTLAVISGMVVDGSRFVSFMSVQMEEAERLNDLPNIPALAGQLGLTTLVNLLVKTDMASALAKLGPFTVFGPTNAAFDAIPSWLKKAIENKETLAKVLEYHVLKKQVLSKDIKDEATIATLYDNKTIRFNIYPNNKVITAQCAPVTAVDKMASNGVIHELSAVMVPPSGNIVEAVTGCPVFKTLVTAVKAAGLVDILGQGPFTLFAPTDSAFKKIDPQTLDNLLKNVTALTYVLKYHVLNLTYCSAGLVSYKELTTLNGRNVTVALDGGKVKVNAATVLAGGADGSVTNGVVHAIDTVLLPPGLHLGH